MLGLVAMCGLLLFGSFNVAICFALPLAASLADQFQAPFNKAAVKIVALIVVWTLLAAAVTLGVTFGSQAIKHTSPEAGVAPK